MAVRVGNSPSERMCCSPAKFFSSNRIQLGKEGEEWGDVSRYLSPPSPWPAQAPLRYSRLDGDPPVQGRPRINGHCSSRD